MEEERLVLEEELEMHKQRLISDMDNLCEALRHGEERINSIRKELNDAQWYLGEERAKKTQMENTLKWFEQRNQELETEISQLKAECSRLQKELNEANWYLGEERSRHQELEKRIQGL